MRAKKSDTESWVLRDRWLIITVLIIAGITIWNSRVDLFPDKFPIEYSKYGFTFRHPKDTDSFWEVGLDNENVFDYTGTIRPSEDRGMVGYSRKGQEVAITWSAMEQVPTLGEILEVYYNSVIVNSERRDREITITRGKLETGEVNGHTTALQFHTLEIMMPGSSEPLYAEGYVSGWYCQSTGRVFFGYVFQWNTGQPPDQTEVQALARLNTFLKTLRCHG